MPKASLITVYNKLPEIDKVGKIVRENYAKLNKIGRDMALVTPVHLDEGEKNNLELSRIIEASLLTLARDINSISRGTWEQYAARYNDVPKRQAGAGGTDMSMTTRLAMTEIMQDTLAYLQSKMPQDLDIWSYKREGKVSPIVITTISVIHAATK